MMDLVRITDPQNVRFKEIVELYREAFPEDERRDIVQLERLLADKPEMYFNAVICDNVLAGLFVYWDFKEFYYLEHLAIYAEMRNKKVGQQVLDWIKANLSGIRLLEVEPADTEIAVRRVAYYERNGYQILDRTYMQPSYRKNGGDFPLWIMGNEQYADSKLLEKHTNTIKMQAYQVNR